MHDSRVSRIPESVYLWLLVAITVVIVWISFAFLPDYPVISDSLKYDEIATGLIEKGSFSEIEGITYAPGYPVFLAILYSISGHDILFVYLVQFILLGLIAISVFVLAKKFLHLKPIYAFLAGALVLLWPYFILYSKLLMTEVFFSLIFIIFVYFFLKHRNSFSPWLAIIPGIILAIATLIRPMLLLLPFWILILLFIWKRETLNKKWWLVFIISFLVILTPWMIFTSTRHDEVVPVASNISSVLEKSFVTLSYEDGIEKIGAKEIIVSKLRNIYLFWNPGASGYQVEALRNHLPAANILIWIYKVGFVLIVLLALAAFRFYKDYTIFFLASIILYFWVVHTLLFPYPRYTLPIIPLVLILALYNIAGYIKKKTNE